MKYFLTIFLSFISLFGHSQLEELIDKTYGDEGYLKIYEDTLGYVYYPKILIDSLDNQYLITRAADFEIVKVLESGILDSEFGDQGTLRIDTLSVGNIYGSLIHEDNIYIILGNQTESFLYSYKLNGDKNTSFGNGNRIRIEGEWGYNYNIGVINNEVIIAKHFRPLSGNEAIVEFQKFTKQGDLVLTDTISFTDLEAESIKFHGVKFADQEEIYFAASAEYLDTSKNYILISRLQDDLELDTSFGEDGTYSTYSGDKKLSNLVLDNGQVIFSMLDSSSDVYVLLDNTGTEIRRQTFDYTQTIIDNNLLFLTTTNLTPYDDGYFFFEYQAFFDDTYDLVLKRFTEELLIDEEYGINGKFVLPWNTRFGNIDSKGRLCFYRNPRRSLTLFRASMYSSSSDEIFLQKNMEVTIFPNPTSSFLVIRSIYPMDQKISCKLVNSQGLEMENYKFYNRVNLDLSAYPDGIYILQLSTKSSEGTFTIFKH